MNEIAQALIDGTLILALTVVVAIVAGFMLETDGGSSDPLRGPP
jgi:hypothetical protein